jgi:hypothetical protein
MLAAMRMPSTHVLALSVALLIALAPIGAAADVVELTTGERIDGRVVQTTATGLVVELADGRLVRFEQSRVAAIRFDPAGRAEAAPAPARAAPAPALSRPVVAPVPRLAPAELEMAFFAFRRLHAATERPMARADYEALIAETRERVDRYLTAPVAEDPDIRQALDTALRYHLFAAAAWARYEARADLRLLGTDPVIAQCRDLRELIARDAARWNFNPLDPGFAGLIAASEGLPALWTCAADAVAHAEERAGRTPEPPGPGAK